ncbi:MAG: SDR family oxidoreductase [Sphingobacteriales bacterium]|nr:SDR family oxidoreductase [Sphingobacteriales bacterium]
MKLLVTGGAGFIGSNLCQALLEDERVSMVRVLDNLATGSIQNIEPFLNHPRFQFINGDICNFDTCKKACIDMDLISHQAALGSVPRSINDPVTTNEVNISGTLNVFTAAKNAGIKKIVYAASSSTYGDSQSLPKIEHIIGKPLSPYAITKLVNELYAEVFHLTYGMHFIGLRYFNVFGPKQNPNGAYAAVIPLFANALLKHESTYINGDGEQSRDFTYIDNAVQANIKAIFSENSEAWDQVYNIACGEQCTINHLFEILKSFTTHSDSQVIHREARPGDVRHSLADIDKAKRLLNYEPKISLKQGLELTLNWYRKHSNYFE